MYTINYAIYYNVIIVYIINTYTSIFCIYIYERVFSVKFLCSYFISLLNCSSWARFLRAIWPQGLIFKATFQGFPFKNVSSLWINIAERGSWGDRLPWVCPQSWELLSKGWKLLPSFKVKLWREGWISPLRCWGKFQSFNERDGLSRFPGGSDCDGNHRVTRRKWLFVLLPAMLTALPSPWPLPLHH